jgi:hypothetical protein
VVHRFWTLSDDYAARICDEQIPIIVTLVGFVVDVFSATGFSRVDGRVVLPACGCRRPQARGRRAELLPPP